MNTFLYWIIPPLAGAIIGYLTNAVAIRMLFRPLKKLYLGAIPLPFTPGILPRERRRLADNIGAMVERELLTVEVLRDRLNRPEVREGVRRSVGAYTETLLARSPSGLLRGLFPGEEPGQGGLGSFLAALGRDILKSPLLPLLQEALGEALAHRAGGLLGKSVRDLLGEEVMESLEGKLRDKIEGFLERARGDKKLWDDFRRTAGGFYPQAAARLITFLGEGEFRRGLEIHGQVFLSRVFFKLNVFQRFFLSAGQYDKTLQDRMPEIIDDLIREVAEFLPAQQERTVDLLSGAFKDALGKGENRRRLARFITERFSTLARRPLEDFLSPADLIGWVGSWRRANFGDDRLPVGAASNESPWVGSWRRANFGDDRLPVGAAPNESPLGGLLGGVLEKVLEKLERAGKGGGGISLGALLSLEGERKDEMDDLIAGKICSLTDEQIGTALRSVNVKALVADRINSLDMLRVERIVLDVMADQLKWINLFGAFLGALIGALQPLLSLLFR